MTAWSDDRRRTLAVLYASRVPVDRIAAAVGLASSQSVYNAAARFNLKRGQQRSRRVNLPPEVLQSLEIEARKRGIGPAALAARIVKAATIDGIVSAVLDDRK